MAGVSPALALARSLLWIGGRSGVDRLGVHERPLHETSARYAPHQHVMSAFTTNVSGAVIGYVANFGLQQHQQQEDDIGGFFGTPGGNGITNGGAGGVMGSGFGELLNEANASDDQSPAGLLMPLWAYRSAAAYLLLISLLGVIMNVIVVIVILNDPQVLGYLIYVINMRHDNIVGNLSYIIMNKKVYRLQPRYTYVRIGPAYIIYCIKVMYLISYLVY